MTDLAKPVTTPMACIKKSEWQSFCNREVNEDREFMFQDAHRAVTIYKDSGVIRACPHCVRNAEADGIGKNQYIAPMATRGTENNR